MHVDVLGSLLDLCKKTEILLIEHQDFMIEIKINRNKKQSKFNFLKTKYGNFTKNS